MVATTRGKKRTKKISSPLASGFGGSPPVGAPVQTRSVTLKKIQLLGGGVRGLNRGMGQTSATKKGRSQWTPADPPWPAVEAPQSGGARERDAEAGVVPLQGARLRSGLDVGPDGGAGATAELQPW